jgi:hypothetical protein
MKHSRLLITTALGLGLALTLLWMLGGPSDVALARRSGLAPVPPSLTRQHAPVVITGGLFSGLTGQPLEEMFVYAYQGTTPTQIPFQIDERNTDGMYVALEDGQLDDNDELVFMAADGGSWVDNPWLYAGGRPITPTHVITITDPISNTHAWAYVFYSDGLSHTFSADYVSYDDGNDRITSPGRYAIGFNTTYAFQDYLTLGSGGPDLLDRNKLRITGTVGSTPISANEQNITKDNIHAIDGPVRVTRVSTSTFTVEGQSVQMTATLFAYRSLVVQPTTMAVPGAPVRTTYYRTSIDWNEQAAGMTHYDANNPAGATIDGITDTIIISPTTRWTQVASVTGTVVNVSDIPAELGGTQSTYYKDDSTVDSDDTGDQCSYGDAGLQVDDPNPGAHTILVHTYFLTGAVTNVGATYTDYYDNPLQASVAVATSNPRWYIYLPIVTRN